MIDLSRGFDPAFGWNEARETEFSELRGQGFVPGRVVAANRELFQLQTEEGEFPGRLAGRLRQSLSNGQETLPVLGDWTAAALNGGLGLIQAVLPRTSFFSRKAAGREIGEQVLAANIDFLFIVIGARPRLQSK